MVQLTGVTDSGDYIMTPQGEKKVYCEMEIKSCGNITGWMRAAYINSHDPKNNCSKWKKNEIVKNVSDPRVEYVRICTRSKMQTQKMAVSQSSLKHLEFPTIGSAEELEDTSTDLHVHSTATSMRLVREPWKDPMFQGCL